MDHQDNQAWWSAMPGNSNHVCNRSAGLNNTLALTKQMTSSQHGVSALYTVCWLLSDWRYWNYSRGPTSGVCRWGRWWESKTIKDSLFLLHFCTCLQTTVCLSEVRILTQATLIRGQSARKSADKSPRPTVIDCDCSPHTTGLQCTTLKMRCRV